MVFVTLDLGLVPDQISEEGSFLAGGGGKWRAPKGRYKAPGTPKRQHRNGPAWASELQRLVGQFKFDGTLAVPMTAEVLPPSKQIR